MFAGRLADAARPFRAAQGGADGHASSIEADQGALGSAARVRLLPPITSADHATLPRDAHTSQVPAVTSTPAWNELDEWTTGRIQEWLQQMLVNEVTEFLGRAKHQRRGVDMRGYRNGYEKPRRLTMRTGTVTVRRPRVRDVANTTGTGRGKLGEQLHGGTGASCRFAGTRRTSCSA